MSNRRGLVGKELKPAVQGVKAGHGKPAMGQSSGRLMIKQLPPKKDVPGAKAGATQSRNTLSSAEVAERLKVSEDAIRDWLKKGLLKGSGTQIQLYEVEKFKAQYPGELTRAQKHKIQDIPTTTPAPPEAAKPKKAAAKVEPAADKKPQKEKKPSSPGILARIFSAVTSGLKSLVTAKKPKKNSEPYDKLALAPKGEKPALAPASRDSGKFHKTNIRASMNAKTPFSNPEPIPVAQAIRQPIPTPRPPAVEEFEFDDERFAPPPPRPVQVQVAPTMAEIQGEKTIQPPSFPEAEPSLDAPPSSHSPTPGRREDRLSLEGRTSAPPPPSGPKLRPSIRRDALQMGQSAPAPTEPAAKRLQTPGLKHPDAKTITPELEGAGGFSLGAPITADNRPPAAPEPITEVSDWLDAPAAPAPEMPAPLAAFSKASSPWDSGEPSYPTLPDPFLQSTPTTTEKVASREKLNTPPPILWDDVPTAPAAEANATDFPWDVPSTETAPTPEPWDLPASGPPVSSNPWATPVAPVADSSWDAAPPGAAEKPTDASPAVPPEKPWNSPSSVAETLLSAPGPVAPESPWVSCDHVLPLASTLGSVGQGPRVPPPFQEPAPYSDGRPRTLELESLQKELEEERKLRILSDLRVEQGLKEIAKQRAAANSNQVDSGQLAALQAELHSSRQLRQSHQAQLEAAQSELRNSQNLLFNGQADLQSAQAEMAHNKSQFNNAQGQMLAMQSQILAMQGQIESAEARFNESERKSMMQAAETVSIDKYRELEEELVATKNIAEALQIASRETTFGEQRLIRELEQKLALHEQGNCEVAVQLQALEQQLQTLDERARHSEHSQQMTEKQLLAVQREKLVLQREQQEFERHWQLKLEDSRQAQESQHEQLSLQDEKHRQAIAHKEKDIRDLNRRLAQLGPTSEEHNQTKAELEEHRGRLEEATKRYKTLEQKHSTQIQRWEKELQAAGNWVGKLTEAVQVKDKRIQELEGLLTQSQSRAKTEGDGQLNAQLLAARVELNTFKRHYEAIQQSLEDAEQELTTVKQENLKLQRELGDTRGTAGSSAEKADASMMKELQHNRELVKQLETEVVATIVKLAAVEREKLELEAQLRDISEDS